MAISDESGMGTTMLVQPSGYAGGNGFGGFGDGGWWILLLFILLGNGAWGNGGGYGNGGLYPWMNQSNQINDGFRDQMINTTLTGIQSGVTNGFANAEISANARQIADMERSFAVQTATTAGFTGLQAQLAQCCCENRLGTADLKYTVATENCADRAAISDGIRDIMAANSANTQRILDQLCQDKIESKNDTIAQLRQELIFARGQASQDVQTAAIQAGQRALANEVEQYVLPTPRPAYIVANPNCCTNTCGCGVM